MRSRYIIPFILINIMLFSSCAKSRIKGVWLVERERKERAGLIEITPQARWIRFEKDYIQESGNGWQKHSVGTWSFKKKKLSIDNTNGYTDYYGSFNVKYVKKGMEWTRVEDGNKVKIFIKKIEEIPQANRDKLLGVWELKRVLEQGKDAGKKYNPDNNMYLFFRWDNVFLVGNSPMGKMSGIYRVNGKLDEVEMFYNNATKDRSTWSIDQEKNSLILTSINNEKEIIMQYVKIDHLPQ